MDERLKDLLNDAEDRLRAGDIEGASKRFLAVAGEDRTVVEAYLGLARASLFLGMKDEADAYAKAALHVAPDRPEVRTMLGLIHEARGQTKKALPFLRQGAETGRDLFFTQYNHGRALAAAGQHGEAVPFLERATAIDPESYEAWYALGVARKEAGDVGKALRAFTKAMRVAPDNVDIYATIADVLIATRDPAGAREVLEEGLRRSPENPALLDRASAVALGQGDAKGAAAYVERLLARVPGHVRGWLNLANLCILTKDLEKSERAAKRAIELDPKSWEAYYHLGNLYEAAGPKLEAQAEKAYRRAVELAPSGEHRPLGNLGALLVEMKDRKKNEEAVKVLERAAALAPKGEWRIHYNLALAHAKLGDKRRARDIVKLIRKSAPPGNEAVALAGVLDRNLAEG